MVKGLLVQGDRVLVPENLYPAVALAHDGPIGIESTLRNLRNKLWFPEIGFKKYLCAPEHPQVNGKAKMMMSSIVKLTHSSISKGKNPKEEITKFLQSYRNTPHSSKGQTPASLLMSRKIRTNLPAIIEPPTTGVNQLAQEPGKGHQW